MHDPSERLNIGTTEKLPHTKNTISIHQTAKYPNGGIRLSGNLENEFFFERIFICCVRPFSFYVHSGKWQIIGIITQIKNIKIDQCYSQCTSHN